MASERVKPCVRCDRLVSFEDSHCAECGAFAGVTTGLPRREARPSIPPARTRAYAEGILLASGAALLAGALTVFLS